MQRLIIVYNPRSSKRDQVEKDVLTQARELQGWMVGKYEVLPTGVADNARRLAMILKEGDLVVAAGGDGTASIAINGCMAFEGKVALGVLGYGNFNDVARIFEMTDLNEIVWCYERNKTREVWPLEARINGEHWRYAMGYFTLGLFAESTEVFDETKVRSELQTGKKGMLYSLWQLVKWYFKNRGRVFLPDFTLNGMPVKRGATDYLAINSRTVARMMNGGETYCEKEQFYSGAAKLKWLLPLGWFMLRAILSKVPSKITIGDRLVFNGTANVEIQAEGEYERLGGVKDVEIKKAQKSLYMTSK